MIDRNQKNLLNRDNVVSTAYYYVVYQPHPAATSVAFFVHSEDDGEAVLEAETTLGWVLDETFAVDADKLTKICRTGPHPKRYRVGWKAAAATGSVVIDAAYSGHAGGVA
jgi:hypothetical protein